MSGSMKRRDFLTTAALGVAGLTIGGRARAYGSATIIDPPPGPLFRDPPVAFNKSTTPGIVEVDIRATPAAVTVGSTAATLLTYNGSYVGPTIKARRGDRVLLNFTNALPNDHSAVNIHGHPKYHTNLHTHGWHVSPSGNADNILLEHMPGDVFQYDYDLSRQEPGVFAFYHPHMHGTAAEQMWAGMVGALDLADDSNVLAGYETHLMLLKDVSISGGAPTPHTMDDYMKGKEGSLVTVNGQLNPVLAIRPGQVQRWRIVNASQARYYRLALEGHPLNLVGTDGGLLDKPYAFNEILLAPGERIDVLIKASTTVKKYRLRSLPYDRGDNAEQQVTLLTLDCRGTPALDGLPGSVNPAARRETINTSGLRRVELTLDMDRDGTASINGKVFESPATAFTLTSKVGTYEIWEIKNRTRMDHPFHQHVNAVQVLSSGWGTQSIYASLPALKDTVNVPSGDSVTLLVPVKDYTGVTVFHCHIVEHEDIGMMGVWNIVP